MDRKKYMASAMRFAYRYAKGQIRNDLSRRIRGNRKVSASELFRKQEKPSMNKSAGRRILNASIHGSGQKKAFSREMKKRTKLLARVMKYALRETRYS